MLWVLIGSVVGFALFIAVMRSLRWRRELRRRLSDQTRLCGCGYNLNGLAVPRCPECGRVVGFDKTFAELGLSEREVRDAMARRAARREPRGP